MKKIKIDKISQQGNNYIVSLGNGTSHTFTSEKAAISFVANTNKFLDTRLYRLKFVFNYTSNLYNSAWGMLDKAPQSEENIKRSFLACQKDFDMAWSRSDWKNGNHFAFLHLFDAAIHLKNVIALLAPYTISKRDTTQLYDEGTLKGIVLIVESELNSYGQDKATGYFTRPQHTELSEEVEWEPKMKVA